jgi:hypothetical protein
MHKYIRLAALGALLISAMNLPQVKAEEEISLTDEQLFEGYIEEAFYGKNKAELYGTDTLPGSASANSQISTGSQLSGVDAKVYGLVRKFVKEVADGRQTSTEMTITAADIGLRKTRFTAAELGVSDVFSQDAIDVLNAMTQYNFSLVQDCLLFDCPYDLYWFDKTNGVRRTGFGYSFRSDSSGSYAELTGNITLRFPVVRDYAKDTFTMNPAKAQTVQKAVENAKAIVNKYAGVSDYEKLAGYKKEICDLVSYNYDAAYGSYAYGNPWQLVWAFDGNPSTNIVCEGYSKAFQYLCDQTEFLDDVCAYSVTGYMDGGGHMWNIVRMPDGKNYHVDVTNCDEGSIGADDLLFMKAPAGGSVSTAYTFNCSGFTVEYRYMSDSLTTFSKEQLTLAAEDYDPSKHIRISLNLPSEIMVGETIEPEVIFDPADTPYREIEWTSMTPSRLSVEENGVLKGLKTGNASVRASAVYGNTVTAGLRVLFTDVPSSGFYYCAPVYWAVDHTITAGFTDEDGLARCFGPERNCTRAQMVTFLWRLAGKPQPKSTAAGFSDVADPSLYYYKAVLWAAEKGITAGYSDGTFRPDDTCLREHAVTFLWRYAGKPAPKTSSNPFNDIYTSDYYYRATLWASEKRIANGYSEGEYAGGFGPKLDCLREHIVTFMYRYAK